MGSMMTESVIELNATATYPVLVTTIPPLHSNHYDEFWTSNSMEVIRITLFSLIIIAAFVGNLLLIAVTAATKSLRTHTNYFLLNMAASDLLVSVICMPIELLRWFKPYVIRSTIACKGVVFLQGVAIGASVLTLVAIATERYLAILFPFDKKFSRRTIVILIVLIWVSSIALMSPVLYVAEVRLIDVDNTTQSDCGEHGWQRPEHAAYFTYFLLCTEYCLPLIIIYFIYMRLFLFLWRHKIPGYEELSFEVKQRLSKKKDRRKRVLRMLVCVVVVFALCHLPQNVMSMLYYVGGENFKAPPYMMIVAFCSEMCLYLNSALNPIIYAFLHRKYQQQLVKLCKCKRRSAAQMNNFKSNKTLQITMNTRMRRSRRKSNCNETSTCDVASSSSLKSDVGHQNENVCRSTEELSHV